VEINPVTKSNSFKYEAKPFLTFKLTQQEADIAIVSLTKQPYEVSADVIAKMRSQFQEQEKKPEENKIEEIKK